jgi:hypothetical protein
MDIISVQSVTKEYKQYKRFKGFWGSFRSLVRVMFGCAEIIRIKKEEKTTGTLA